jgi:hypothetical protein
MANAPVVVPYALTQLATGVTLDATLTTAQTVFTVGNAEKCVPQFIVFRDASATVNAATTVSIGNSNSATAYYNASTALQSMLTSTGAIVLPLYGSSVATAVAYLTGTQNFTATFGGTLTSNGKVKVDVLGYLTVF